MSIIQIRKPIWEGTSYGLKKGMKVGIAEHRLRPVTEIEILYENKEGERLFPDIYWITRRKALTYPVQVIKGVRLRIIPIEDLEIVKK